jgi:Icc protein
VIPGSTNFNMADNPESRAVTLLQITDTHLHAAADSRMRGVTTYETFLAVLRLAQGDPRWPPDAIVVTGDIVQDESPAGYERFRASLEPFGRPVFCLPGNHDDPKLMRRLLRNPPFQVCGRASLGEWTLILLNTFLPGEDAGALGPQRLEALRRNLVEDSGRYVLVCMHHQPLPMGSTWLDGVGLRDATEFLQLIEQYERVRAVLWGHVHQASDRRRGGIRFLSTPSTCSQFLPGSEFFALDSRPAGLRWLTLRPDGEIDTEVSWVDPSRK